MSVAIPCGAPAAAQRPMKPHVALGEGGKALWAHGAGTTVHQLPDEYKHLLLPEPSSFKDDLHYKSSEVLAEGNLRLHCGPRPQRAWGSHWTRCPRTITAQNTARASEATTFSLILDRSLRHPRRERELHHPACDSAENETATRNQLIDHGAVRPCDGAKGSMFATENKTQLLWASSGTRPVRGSAG